MIYENNNIDKLVNDIYKPHQNESQESSVIKSLQKKRAQTLKASNNLISAIEQGVVTEQTKIRLKALESQISQYDFDIEQTKHNALKFWCFDIVNLLL